MIAARLKREQAQHLSTGDSSNQAGRDKVGAANDQLVKNRHPTAFAASWHDWNWSQRNAPRCIIKHQFEMTRLDSFHQHRRHDLTFQRTTGHLVFIVLVTKSRFRASYADGPDFAPRPRVGSPT